MNQSFSDLLMTGITSFQSNDGKDIRNVINNMISSNSIANGTWQPCADVIDENDFISIYMDLPGINRDNINVDFLNNKLSITGKREKQYGGIPKEANICYGKFIRNVDLPLSVTNKENVDVSYEDGVLLIVINKKKEIKNRFRINLGSSSNLPTGIV